MGPARGGAGPIVVVPGRLYWMRRSAGVGFRRVVPDTRDYFLRQPKAVRLHPSSKSGPHMIISCGDLRLVGSTRHRKVVQNPHSISLRSGWWPLGSVGWCLKGCTRIHTIYSVARSLVGGPAARWGGVPKSCTRTPTL